QSGSSTPFLASAAAVLASSAVCSTCFCVAWPIAFCCWTCPFSSRISSSACRSFSSRSRSRFSVGVSAAARPEGRTRLAASTTTNTNDCFIPTSAVGVSWSTSSPLASLVYNRPVAETTLVVHNWPADRVVDRLPGDGAAVATPPGWLRRPGGATFVLRRDGETISALWLGAPGEVEVRASPSRSAPLLGTVDASRDDGAIRLSLRPAGGAALRTDVPEVGRASWRDGGEIAGV